MPAYHWNTPNHVRTFTGAWIETTFALAAPDGAAVRTFTGAWIETLDMLAITKNDGSHLHGCVD